MHSQLTAHVMSGRIGRKRIQDWKVRIRGPSSYGPNDTTILHIIPDRFPPSVDFFSLFLGNMRMFVFTISINVLCGRVHLCVYLFQNNGSLKMQKIG